MHVLGLFLAAWIALSLATVFFLYWLCNRTATEVKEPGSASRRPEKKRAIS
jgi:hypothetical protein